MWPNNPHPIWTVGLILIAAREIGVAVRYLLQTGGSACTRLSLWVPAALFHAGALLVVIAAMLIVAAMVPWLPRIVAAIAAFAMILLGIAGQADLTVASITGAPLTPTAFRTVRGIHVVKSNEFLEPIRAHWKIVTLGVVGGALAVVQIAMIIAAPVAGPPDLRTIAALVAAGAALMLVAKHVPWPGPPPPIEYAFAIEYLQLDRVNLGSNEAAAIAALRERVGLPDGAEWVSDRFPLVYRPASPAVLSDEPLAAVSRPDIIVVMVESLRSADMSFVTGSRNTTTPHLDRFAAGAVVFDRYISNGFPTAPSVLAFHCSAWPHRRKEIITDFSDVAFDSIPVRLASLGYRTLYVGADPHFDNQDVWMSRWYATSVDLVASGISATDRNIVSSAIAEIQRHDDSNPAAPLFACIATYSTHYPFRIVADGTERALARSIHLPQQYREVLRYTDEEVGRLLTFVRSRKRASRTVTIVLGDHAFYLDLRQTTGLPVNDVEWTPAMVAGPSELIGGPRRVSESASHVDMLPTIAALAGDYRPTSAVGSNLFGPPRIAPRCALAVRPGGIRYDCGGASAYLDARVPDRVDVRRSFPELDGASHAIAAASIDAARLNAWVDTWSYLIEQRRVWDPSLLDEGSASATPAAIEVAQR